MRRSCMAALDSFERERMSAAATILRASCRTRLAGSGVGLDIARFGAEALREAGVEAFAQHATDLAAFTSGYDPAEAVIGVDTDASDVKTAVARARASGIRTIALSDRELTRVRADVLLPHPGFSVDGARDASPLAASIARRINQISVASQLPAALPLHLADVRSSEWGFRPGDALIALEPQMDASEPVGDLQQQWMPAVSRWRIGSAPGGPAWFTRLPGQSPALASLAALYLLEHLLLELAGE